jgi:hypothetical protein
MVAMSNAFAGNIRDDQKQSAVPSGLIAMEGVTTIIAEPPLSPHISVTMRKAIISTRKTRRAGESLRRSARESARAA